VNWQTTGSKRTWPPTKAALPDQLMHGFKTVPPISLRRFSKEAKPPFGEIQPCSALIISFCLTCTLFRLCCPAPEFIVSVHRQLPSHGLNQRNIMLPFWERGQPF